jgi:hypothetical protein
MAASWKLDKFHHFDRAAQARVRNQLFQTGEIRALSSQSTRVGLLVGKGGNCVTG